MEQEISFQIKNHKKLNTKIIFITYLKEKLSRDENILELALKEWERLIVENSKCIVIIDTRSLKSVSYEYLWSKLDRITQMDTIIKSNVICIVYLINNKIFKVMANSIMSIYKPVTKIRLANSIEDGMKFINTFNSINQENDEKE
tara:strand:- start:130 stop:564 length:435 start_codon:yes stop_codon:yes gene_type:complete